MPRASGGVAARVREAAPRRSRGHCRRSMAVALHHHSRGPARRVASVHAEGKLITLPIDVSRGGTVLLTAQERVVFGQNAEQAVRVEVERAGARRVFVTSGASLSRLNDGPLQRIEAALGSRLVGRYFGMRA